MKLYTSARAPNPRRITMFMAEKGMAGVEQVAVDITAFCGLEFARGLMKFRPGDAGMAYLQAYRDSIAARPSAAAPW